MISLQSSIWSLLLLSCWPLPFQILHCRSKDTSDVMIGNFCCVDSESWFPCRPRTGLTGRKHICLRVVGLGQVDLLALLSMTCWSCGLPILYRCQTLSFFYWNRSELFSLREAISFIMLFTSPQKHTSEEIHDATISGHPVCLDGRSVTWLI